MHATALQYSHCIESPAAKKLVLLSIVGVACFQAEYYLPAAPKTHR